MIDRKLFARFLRENPFQPATGLWRAVEIGHVIAHGLPKGRGLDIGCGDGRLMKILVEAGGADGPIVGIDLDTLEVASAGRTGVYERVVACSADAIPEPDSSFDYVFSNSVLEHVAPIEGTFAEIGRLLRPGGTFVFTVPTERFHDCLHGPLYGSRDRYLTMIDRRCAHLRYWSVEEWRAILDRHGMDLETSEGYLTVSETHRWETISRLTAGVLYRITGKQPINIQRGLGMRNGQRLPSWLASTLSWVLSLGVSRESAGPYASRYLVARRRAI